MTEQEPVVFVGYPLEGKTQKLSVFWCQLDVKILVDGDEPMPALLKFSLTVSMAGMLAVAGAV